MAGYRNNTRPRYRRNPPAPRPGLQFGPKVKDEASGFYIYENQTVLQRGVRVSERDHTIDIDDKPG